nr:hypothetical protein [Allomuricauda sp.]
MKLKAGSLLYAVYICLLISIFCGALIFIFNLDLQLTQRQSIRSELIDRCSSCLNYYMSQSNLDLEEATQKIDLFEDGLQCAATKSDWGAFSIIQVKAFFKKDTIAQTAFIGKKNDYEDLAIYLCDWGDDLKVSGLTQLQGDLKIPNGRHRKISILGNSQLNQPMIDGAVSSSTQLLPEIKDNILDEPKVAQATILSQIRSRKLVFNDFDSPTMLIEVSKNERVSNRILKGNIRLHSLDTIYIENTSELQDIMVTAPKVVIESGFKGSLQAFAGNEIVVEENVLLDYPSGLFIFPGQYEFDKKITVAKNARVFGGIIIQGDSFDQKESNSISVQSEAMIMGDIYCNGILELQGTVNGSIFAHKLNLETKNGSYENTLLNAEVKATERPPGMLSPCLWFKNDNNTNGHGIVKTL